MAGPHVHVAVVVAGVHTHAHAHVTHVHDGWCPFVKVEGSSLNRVVTNCYDRSEKIEEALDDFWSQAMCILLLYPHLLIYLPEGYAESKCENRSDARANSKFGDSRVAAS